jgi:apolipoprotein N-acyltransferase
VPSILAALLSGALLVLAYPKYDLNWLAWIGLVPLFLALSGKNLKFSFLLSLICGLVFYPGVFYWIMRIPGYNLLHHSILGLYLGAYFALFGLIFSLIDKRCGLILAFFSAPFIWVSMEFFRSSLSFLALPWALLGHTQYQQLGLIQFASFTGAYGISFLIVLVNTTLASLILATFSRVEKFQSLNRRTPPKKGVLTQTAITTGLIALALLHGQITISRPVNEKKIKASVLQGNIEQFKKWDPDYADFIMKTYLDLSAEAARNDPDLIIWPEASTPGFILKNLRYLKQVIALIQETKTHFLIGSSEYPKFQKADLDPEKTGNSALFFSAQGKVLGQYLKNRLVPFKEYIPYEGVIKWPQFIAPEERKTFDVQGKEIVLFELDGAKFGAVICWESLFPDLFRQFVNQGANFIINITSEAWFGESAFPHQFLAINVFRAVENRVSVARAANTGISCFIDPHGKIYSRLRIDNKDLFVRGYLTDNITISNERTFYTLYGDIFVYACLLVTALMIVISALRRHKRL